ncbi:MAG: MBL fold metallo-hydrolase [Alphaproteobacteria bacterium]|nr:MBL fold metallo-hydrolase [Alphaproteobacteria bacterium]
MKVTVLGCGSSGGTPLLGPDGWADIDRNNPKNRRRRPSIVVETDDIRILVDTSPDLRMQLMDAEIWDIDAILFTHAHADHVNGIDDIRTLNYRKGGAIDAWGAADTLEILQERFGYVFEPYPKPQPQFWRPCLTPNALNGPLTLGDIDIRWFRQEHGRMPSVGFRFGDFGYSTDVKTLPEEAFDILAGIDTWIVDSLGETPHPTHSHLAQTLEWIDRLRPRRAILTHLSHRVDYERLRQKLPDGVEPAYDGMVLEIPG